MDSHTATETAYRNGYAEGFADARKALLPCKIGDKVFGLKQYCDQILVRRGKVRAMEYDQNMNLVIHVERICTGTWGKDIFPTPDEAFAELKSRGRLVG